MSTRPTDPKPRPVRPRGTAPKRGRPEGGAGPTEEQARTITAYIRGGAFEHAAAQAAGVSARTFREWMARGEGRHPKRRSTPPLRAFARQVNRAKAEARVGAEVRVYQNDPKYWLPRAARSTAELEGWTELIRDGAPADASWREEDLDGELARMLGELLAAGTIAIPRCSHPRCRCPYHRKIRTQAAS
jgi:hypothetical protein